MISRTARPEASRSPCHDRHSAAYAPVRRHQLLVRAEFGEPAVLHHGHPVRVVRGVQPVGDGDDRAAVRGRRPGRARCAGRSSGRAARSPRRGSACAGRPAPRGPARAAGPGRRRCGGRPSPSAVSRPSGSSRTQSSAPTAASAAHNSSSVAAGSAIRRLSRTVPQEDVVLLGDEDDLAAQPLGRQVDDRHAADRHRARASARRRRPAAGSAWTCRRRTGRPPRAVRPAARSGRRRAAPRRPRS